MAVGKALLNLLSEVRLERHNLGSGGTLMRSQNILIKVRAADVRITALLKPEAAKKYLDDILDAREKDQEAIARLKEYEKLVDLPKEGEVIPQRLAWQIIQQISGLDIAHFMGKELMIDGHRIKVIDPRPNNFLFEIGVEATTEAFGNLKLEKHSSWQTLTARIAPDWIVLTDPEGGTHKHNPNHGNFSVKWPIFFDPADLSGPDEKVDHSRSKIICEVKDLNLKNIVAGLLREIVDNGYLLGSQGK